MAKAAYILRSTPGGAPVSGEEVVVTDPTGANTYATLSTNADGIATFEQDGSPGPLLAEATVTGRTVLRDGRSLDQLGTWFPNDAPRVWRTLGNGVIPGYTDPQIEQEDMQVSPGSGLEVIVGEGVILIDGHQYACTDPTALAIDPNTSGSTRFDRIIVRFTREGQTLGGKCELAILKGTPGEGTGPGGLAHPAMTKNDSVFEFSLARVTVIDSASSFVSGDVADERYSPTLNQAYVFANPNAFDNASTSLRAGDTLYVNNSGKLVRLARGTDGQVLRLASGLPGWGSQLITVADISDLTASATELNYSGGVTSGIQNQLNAKANTSHVHSGADITSGTVPFAQLPTGTGSSQVAIGNHTHTSASILPSQSGQSGKFLTTNGSAASWGDAGGGGTWGSITGTLSSQTDLQSALNAKANSSHSHTAFQNFGVRAQRNAVSAGGFTVSNTTQEDITGLSDTQALSNGVTYDLFVMGQAQLSAGAGGSVEVAIEVLDGGGNAIWNKTNWWVGTPTEGGERSVGPVAEVNGIAGGQTITVKMVARRTTSNGLVGTASFIGWFVPRGVGGVS